MEENEEKQAVYPLLARDIGDLTRIVEHIGADPRALRYLQPKRRILSLFAPSVDYRAAAFIKQELLSRGGDAVVAKHVIDGQTERSGILIMGTDSQLFRLLQKLESMDCWGLKEFRTNLNTVLKNGAIQRWTLSLPRGRELLLGSGTKVMGILNLTPDSFYAPSRVAGEKELLSRAGAMLDEGADILDLGAESTRPGASPLNEKEERDRLLPRLRALRRAFPDAVLSVDTCKGAVALAAADEGADIINDVSGSSLDEAMFTNAARTGLPYILGHMEGTPATMTAIPNPKDLMTKLHLYFQEKLRTAEEAGLPRERVILDPGIGFAKRGNSDRLIVKEAESLHALGRPLLFGHSRKGVTGKSLPGTVALSAMLEGRIEIVRVHDVGPNRQALDVACSVREANPWP
ncbi:MAG: dihydropteroate synthase [Fretibacterium sp.]|nr:dihydropteroate synthase [Fretibacterium sp.]